MQANRNKLQHLLIKQFDWFKPLIKLFRELMIYDYLKPAFWLRLGGHQDMNFGRNLLALVFLGVLLSLGAK